MDWNRLIGSPASGTYLNPTGSELAKVNAYAREQARGARDLGQFATGVMPPTHFDPLALAGYAVGNAITDRVVGEPEQGIQPAQFTPAGLATYMVAEPLRALAEASAQKYDARRAALPPAPARDPNYWANISAQRHAREGTASTVRPYLPAVVAAH